MLSESTAASAAGSELRRTWAATATLLVVLLSVAWVVELRKETRVLVDGPLALPDAPASAELPEGDDLVDRAVIMTPAFTIDEATTLTMTLRQDATEGWVGVDLALIEETTGEVRQLSLGTNVQHDAAGEAASQRHNTSLVDRVTPGRYVVRVVPSWEPIRGLTAPTPESPSDASRWTAPPTASLRIVEGRRSFWSLGLAAFLLLVPALVLSGRTWFAARRPRQSSRPGETGDAGSDS